MFWRKRNKPTSPELRKYRDIVLRDALALVKLANDVEQQSARDAGLDTTTSQDLAHAHSLLQAERVLAKHITLACDHGMTMSQISSEVIEPMAARQVVGELAWFALEQSVRDAKIRSGPTRGRG